MQGRFKQIRVFYGLSQAQFAQRIHMSPGFISNVETGRSNISERTIDSVCEAFPISRDWLTRGKGEMLVEVGEHNPVDKEGINSRVKEVRKWAGMTQEEFAGRIGYSKIQVHSVEKGKVAPSNQFLEKIVAEFRVSSDWLFTGMGSMETMEYGVDDQLINWLNDHPEVVRELRQRGGLD